MAIQPIEAPIALDLTLRESPGGGLRSRRASVPAPAAAAPAPDGSESASSSATPTPVEGQLAQMNLKFSTDEQTGKTIVSLVDPNGNVLRQMPSAEALKVAEAIGKFQGMFVDLKV